MNMYFVSFFILFLILITAYYSFLKKVNLVYDNELF